MGPERGASAGRFPGDPWRSREEDSFLLGAILGCAQRLRRPIAAVGVDYPRFRELLRTRLILSQRSSSASSRSLGAAGAVLALMMSWFAGFLAGLPALLTGTGELWVLISQTLVMFLLTLLLFQQLVSILVDPTDIGVVSPHPVPDRTVFAVRLAEVSVYVLGFVLAFTAGSVILPLFKLPPLAVLLVYPALSLLCAAVTLGLVTLLLALCLRVAGPAHFQRVSLWLQISGGAGVFLVLQLSRLIPKEHWTQWLSQHQGLRYAVPPLLYTDLFAYACGEGGTFPLGAALVATLVPLAALVLTFLLASRYFIAGLQGTLGAPARRSGCERGLLARLGARLRGREERAGFDFALALARREPPLLRAILPQLGMFQVMALGSGFGLRRDLAYFVPASAGFLFMVLPHVLLMSQGTSTPEARGLFTTAPLESEDAVLRGGVKGLLLQWIGVPAGLVFVIQLGVCGLGALPSIVLAFELSFVATLLFTRLFHLGVPFTRSIRTGETGAANLGLILMMGVAMGILVLLHVALTLHPIALAAGIIGSTEALIVLWRRLASLKVAQEKRMLVPGTRLVLE